MWLIPCHPSQRAETQACVGLLGHTTKPQMPEIHWMISSCKESYKTKINNHAVSRNGSDLGSVCKAYNY